MDKRDNLTLGYFASLPLRDTVMAASYVYFVSNLIWLIPPGKPFGEFEKLLMPFQNEIWIACSGIFSIAFLVIFIIKYFGSKSTWSFVFGRRIVSPEFNIIRIVLNGSMPILPTRNFARSILMIFMLFCFIIQNSYTGRLFYYMKNSLSHPDFETQNQLIENNFTFYTTPPSRDFLLGFPRILERLRLTDSQGYQRLSAASVDPNEKIALLTSQDHLIWRNINALPERFFSHAAEVIFRNNIVIYMHKQSCLVNEVNQILLSLTSGGLIRYFASTIINPALAKKPNASKIKSLNLEQLNGAFELLAVGLLLSSLVFTIELTFTRSSKLFHYYFRRRQ